MPQKKNPSKNTTGRSASNHSPSKQTAGKKTKTSITENTVTLSSYKYVLVLVVLAVLSILGWFESDGVILGLLFKLERGLFGYGAYPLVLAMLASVVFIVDGNDATGKTQIYSSFFVTPFFGAIAFVFDYISFENTTLAQLFPILWKDGISGEPAGIFSGLIGYGLIKAISKTGAILFLLAALCLCFYLCLYEVIRDVRKIDEDAGRKKKPKTTYSKKLARGYVDTRNSVEQRLGETKQQLNDRREERRQQKEAERILQIEEAEKAAAAKKALEIEAQLQTGQTASSKKASAQKTTVPEKEYSPLFPDAYFPDGSNEYGEPVLAEDKTPDRTIPEMRGELLAGRRKERTSSSKLVPNKAEKQMAPFNPQEYWPDEDEPLVSVSSMQQEPVAAVPEEAQEAVSHEPEYIREPEEPVVLPDYDETDSLFLEDELQEDATEAYSVSSEPEAVTAPEPAVLTPVDVDPNANSYIFPPIDLLKKHNSGQAASDAENMRRLQEALQSFGIDPDIKQVVVGPTVTRYELNLKSGVKLAKVTGLSNDIALALGTSGVRIAAVPGEISVVGIEVPNRSVSTVFLRDVLDSDEFNHSKSDVSFAVGKDIGNHRCIGNIAKLPHLLIAGTTGSGKSVCMNSLIISLLYKSGPEDVKLIMIDPKMVELGVYNNIPHLLLPVVTDPKKAAGSLHWAVEEMLRRYSMMSETGVRDIESYNRKIAANPERTKLPKLVVIIDELADLMLVAAKDVEESICRIAQMGRAAGVHLVIATQRPSANVITGLMKANIPSRIAFAVASAMESRIILDSPGAEKLVGKGDMLYAPLGEGKAKRIQGCYVSDEEVENVTEFIKRSSRNTVDSRKIEAEIEMLSLGKNQPRDTVNTEDRGEEASDFDDFLFDAVDVFMETQQASVSLLQRKLKLGYARASRIVDQMEEIGIVGPYKGSKPRDIIISRDKWEAIKAAGDLKAILEED